MSSLICLIEPVDKKAVKNIEGVPDIWDGLRKLDDMVGINNNVKDKQSRLWLNLMIQLWRPILPDIFWLCLMII